MVQLREGCQSFGCQESVQFKHGTTSDHYPETLLHWKQGWGCHNVEFLSWPRRDCQTRQHSYTSGWMAY